MLLKTPVIQSYIKEKLKGTFSPERLQSRSKLDKRKYRIILKKPNEPNELNIINSNSERKINKSFSPSININTPIKDKMPYIPNIERQKAESNFIKLIKNLVNSRKKEKNNLNINIFNKNQKNIPYKPKGYNYYEYIRENPIIITEDDDNIYSKVVNDLQKNTEINKNNNYNNNEYSKSYKNLNKLTKNKNNLNISSNEDNNEINFNPINSNDKKYFKTIDYNIDNNNEDISKSDRINHKTIDNEDHINKKRLLPIINNRNNNLIINDNNKQKDYRQSDIFYLINNNLSKNKSSEKYLFKKNYAPQKIENIKKTGINEVGWSPKGEKNKSRIGCSSVAFNILSPDLKHFAPMKKDIDLLNKNNFEKAPLMSEYVDMCKPGDINLRQEFSEKLNENKNVFHKKNYCAAYNDLHHEYKDLINNAF